jgi:hypothetical protein
MRRDALTIVLGLAGLGNLANGLWMLADPAGWWATFPAGVPDFGPLNEHFVRDIGSVFVLQGAALAVAAVVTRWRVAACGAVAAFSVLHAVVHVIDTWRGLVGPEHWLVDAPGVYGTAMLMVGLTVAVARRPA